ncbi:nf-kappa-b-repressing factor-related [Anaeramoeba flamelloides]|uniref:Nf-kappa-b-repressing factor-related n=1 Tax=Anaeramoeba flamelloides TaxID=1746091 RepID=A0ABQ8YPV6_9EUKA|nr:nf-kappa-b-repressing factor-related [Anaeramoeba flamelloides]
MTYDVNEADFCEADYIEENNENTMSQSLLDNNNNNNYYNNNPYVTYNNTNQTTKPSDLYTLTGLRIPNNSTIYKYVNNKNLTPKMPTYFSLFWFLFSLVVFVIQQCFVIFYLEKISIVRWYIPFVVTILLLVPYLSVLKLVKAKTLFKVIPRTHTEETSQVSNRSVKVLNALLVAQTIQFMVFIVFLRYAGHSDRWDSKWGNLSKDGLLYIISLSSFFYYAYAKILRPADRCDPLNNYLDLWGIEIAIDAFDLSDFFVVGSWYLLSSDGLDKSQVHDLIKASWGKSLASFPYIVDIVILLWLISIAVRIVNYLSLHYDFEQRFWRKFSPTRDEDSVDLIQEIVDEGGITSISQYNYGLQNGYSVPRFLQSKKLNGHTILAIKDPKSNEDREEEFKSLIAQADEIEEISSIQEMRFQYTLITRGNVGLRLNKSMIKYTLPCNLLSLALRLILLIQVKNSIQILLIAKNIFSIYRDMSVISQSINPNQFWLKGKCLKLLTKTNLLIYTTVCAIVYGAICTLADIYIYKLKGNSAWAAPPFTLVLMVAMVILAKVSIIKLGDNNFYDPYDLLGLWLPMCFFCTIAFVSRSVVLYWGFSKLKVDGAWGQNWLFLLMLSFTIPFWLYSRITVYLGKLISKSEIGRSRSAYLKFIEPGYIYSKISILIVALNSDSVSAIMDVLCAIALFNVSRADGIPKSMHRACIAFFFIEISVTTVKTVLNSTFLPDNKQTDISAILTLLNGFRLIEEPAIFIIRIVLAAKYNIYQPIWLFKNFLAIINWLSLVEKYQVLFRYDHYHSLFPEIPRKGIF